jgi:RNase P subunit RPR2
MNDLTEGEKSAIFRAFVERELYGDKTTDALTQITRKPEGQQVFGNGNIIRTRCYQCGKGLSAGEERQYLDNFTFKVICLTCVERNRINNRERTKAQRTLL